MSHQISWLPSNRIALLDPRAQRRLEALLAETCAGKAASGSFPSRGSGQGKIAVMHVLPIASIARDLFGGGFTILVIASTSDGHTDPGLIKGLFDLSAAEAEVAVLLAMGKSIESIAATRGTAIGTVRVQVKSLFEKTNTGRQAELAALLNAIPRSV